MVMTAYVGCRTTKVRNARGEGILVFDVSPERGWIRKQCIKTEENPSYLCLDHTGVFLYCVHGDMTKASSFRVKDDGTLEYLNTLDIGGHNPVVLILDRDNRWIYMVEEKGNKVLYFSFDERSGSLEAMQELSTVPETETRYSDAGEIMIDPSGRYVLVSNRYTDTLAVYRIDPQTGYLRPHGFHDCLCKTPRFFCFGPDGHCYVAGEDSDTVIDFAWDSDSGRLGAAGQIIRCGIPFSLTIPEEPQRLDSLSPAKLNAKLQHSYEQSLAGEGRPDAEVFDELERSLV